MQLASIQMSCSEDPATNRSRAVDFVRVAASSGAQIILLPEFFETHYFCKTQEVDFYELAHPWDSHPLRALFEPLAAELRVVLPISFYERAGRSFFNSAAVIDANGETLGVYRKSHIPQAPGYEEKFYFSPGDTGFRVWPTAHGRIGVGICWDQWFPEAARIMALQGAEVLLYPTAIGTEPLLPGLDSSSHWQTVQRGHAGANMIPLVAANRVGSEKRGNSAATFYGSSFIAGARGEILAAAGREEETILTATVDPAHNERERIEWGIFRDRRCDLYGRILAL